MSKPCSGCPDQIPFADENVPEGKDPKTALRYKNAWVVWSEGTFEQQLELIQHSLPEGYDRVTVHGDGSIRYEKGLGDWEPPSPIEGYERDSVDECLFRPLWDACRVRAFSTVVKESCQCVQVLARCLHPDRGEESIKDIKHADCLACQKRWKI